MVGRELRSCKLKRVPTFNFNYSMWNISIGFFPDNHFGGSDRSYGPYSFEDGYERSW